MTAILTFFALIPFYLLGAFPSGYLIAKRHHIDITKQGSGNVGATNVTRILGKKAGITTLIIDIGKGFLATVIAYFITGGDITFTSLAGFAAILGHTISIPKKLPAGKGVATSAGVFLFLAPLPLLISLLIFAIFFAWQRIVSLASLTATFTLTLATILTNQKSSVILISICASLIIFYKHKQNIERYIKGKETKFYLK